MMLALLFTRRFNRFDSYIVVPLTLYAAIGSHPALCLVVLFAGCAASVAGERLLATTPEANS